MTGYKLPCRYCSTIIPPDAVVCPICTKINPIHLRCPKCKELLQKNYAACPSCGLLLRIKCPICSADTFFGDYCDTCGARLLVICPNPKCKMEQSPVQDKCIRCGKPLK